MIQGSKTSIADATVSSVPKLAARQPDAADVAAAYFGDRLLLRVDPRDVIRNSANPTGAKRIHLCEPNRDALLFSGTNISVGKVAGKYDSKEVFRFSTAGSFNNLRTRPKSLNNVTQFTVFGVAHIDSAMLGTSGFHTLLAWYRDGANLESAFAHQYIAGVNYLSLYADQADGGGANINLDTTPAIDPDIPFAYMLRVVGTHPGNSRVSIYINQTDTETAVQPGSGIPEAGSIELFLGHLIDSSSQWTGGQGKLLIIEGDTLGTDEDAAASAALMAAMKSVYGVA